jgi:hypothetical protein
VGRTPWVILYPGHAIIKHDIVYKFYPREKFEQVDEINTVLITNANTCSSE